MSAEGSTFLVAWVVFPALLALLCLGCGLLLEVVSARRLPGALLLPAGLAVIIVAAQATTSSSAAAQLTAPLVVALAVAGFILSPPWRRGRIEPWTAGAAIAVFAISAAPIVLSGKPTFAGYIKLDDTATWLALADRALEHGRSLAGLSPSSYEATLSFYLAFGYPIGSFLPIGIAHPLLSTDVAWLFQPSMSFFTAMLALSISELVRPMIRAVRSRALVTLIAAQPALLYGYLMWGGIKEVAAAAALALTAALVPGAILPKAPLGIVPLAVACGALLAILGPAGAIWLAPLLLVVLALALRGLGRLVTLRRAACFAAVVGLLSIPLLTGGAFKAATNPVLYASNEIGNLFGPLNVFQAVGIWPAADFRLPSVNGAITAVLIAAALFAATVGIALAFRARATPLLIFSLGGIAAALAIGATGSPWVNAKALATLSPAVLVMAIAGAVSLWQRRARAAGAILIALIVLGVLWSNVLAYGGVNLAPYDQLSELQRIGKQIAGQGPTLMTEYQPYGVRHFLRNSDPEGVSELRRRVIPLRSGGTVPKGSSADTDQLQLDGLLVYRTLVLRRGPNQSRPPSPYVLLSRGRFYDVWQRPAGVPSRLIHVPLGSSQEPTGPISCVNVERLARLAGSGGQVAYAQRPPNVVFALSRFAHPASWSEPAGDMVRLASGGSAILRVQLPGSGVWRAWLGGSVRSRLDLLIDGHRVGSVRQALNFDDYTDLGAIDLGPGSHEVELRYHGADLHPGSAGPPTSVGPLVFSTQEASDEAVQYLPTARAGELCGRRLDWIEAIPR